MMFDCHYWSFLLSKLSCHNYTKTTSWTKPALDNLWPALQPFSYILVVWTLTPGGLPHYSQLPLRSESKPCTSFPKTTVQLSCKVTFALIPDVSCMHFRRVSYTFWTRSTCVLDASPSEEKGAWCSLTFCCSFTTRFYACTDVSRAHSTKLVLHTFQTRIACVSDVSERYLGAELCSSSKELNPNNFFLPHGLH